MDAKYHYEFWRPVTAIRNGDSDDNPATERDATWQPIDNTPMHPEYPCAHCIGSAALAAVGEAAFGTAKVPEIAVVSSSAPGITHRWTDLHAYADEVAYAASGRASTTGSRSASGRTWDARSVNTWSTT